MEAMTRVPQTCGFGTLGNSYVYYKLICMEAMTRVPQTCGFGTLDCDVNATDLAFCARQYGVQTREQNAE
ncbi:hypothetical protein J6590_040617 [Homalodisca vitripennis]|nr:hypothetical protein J6590_040617 [Homalodisca vitripennis]